MTCDVLRSSLMFVTKMLIYEENDGSENSNPRRSSFEEAEQKPLEIAALMPDKNGRLESASDQMGC
jgi:hypothetical protein